MRIWIVSSDPFYREFEKIAEDWPKTDEIRIGLVSKLKFDLRGLWIFCHTYLDFKPEVILSDHGYFGFWFIKRLGQLLGVKTKYITLLRGNYWLEKRLRDE